MATLLDVTLLEGFQGIIVFLLVWIIVYGVLAWRTPFGEDKTGLYVFIAIGLALITLFSQSVVALVLAIAPWFVLIAIFVFFIVILLITVGYDQEAIQSTIKGDEWGQTITVWLIIIAVIILLGGLGSVFFSPGGAFAGTEGSDAPVDSGLQEGEVGDTGPGAFFATLVHPKVLGMIMILMIAFLTIQFLGRPPAAPKGKD